MVGLTIVQAKQLMEWSKELWCLLDQDDFNNIAEIFKNAVDREEYFQTESEGVND